MEDLNHIDNIPISTGTEFDNFELGGSICEAKDGYQTKNAFIDRFIENWTKLNKLTINPTPETSERETVYHLTPDFDTENSYNLVLHYNNDNTQLQAIYLTMPRILDVIDTVIKIEPSKNGALRFTVFKTVDGALELSSGLIVYPDKQPSLLLQSKFDFSAESSSLADQRREYKREFEAFRVPDSCNDLCATTIANVFKLNPEQTEVTKFYQYQDDYTGIMTAIQNFTGAHTTPLFPTAEWQSVTHPTLSLYFENSTLAINIPELDIKLPLTRFSRLWVERQDDSGNTVFYISTDTREHIITVNPEGRIVNTFNRDFEELNFKQYRYITFASTHSGETVEIVTTGRSYNTGEHRTPFTYFVTITPIPNNGELYTSQIIELNAGKRIKQISHIQIPQS